MKNPLCQFNLLLILNVGCLFIREFTVSDETVYGFMPV